MNNDPSCLTNSKSYKGNSQVMMGDGNFLNILQTGDTILDTNSVQFHLHDVLYVPSLKANLISIAQFTKENSVSFEIFPWGYHINDLDTKEILAEGLVKYNLYPLTSLQASHVAAHSASLHSSDPWHRKLGHTSSTIIHKVASSAGISINTSSYSQLYTSCQWASIIGFLFIIQIESQLNLCT